MTGDAQRILCLGLGYAAGHLAAAAAARGIAVAGTSRTEAGRTDLVARGYGGYRFDGHGPMGDIATALAGTTHLLASVPPGEGGDPVLHHHARHIAACGTLGWIGYLSTTGVYGDRAGGWVDEHTVPDPGSETAERRLAAEGAWLTLGALHGIPVHIFRLAGIYGPGRNALVQLRAGTARRIIKPGHVFSRIHVADIVTVLLASMTRPKAGAIYNVCDDEPAAQADVLGHAATLLGVAPPPAEPFETADLSDAARRFYADNRRVRNRRIKDELGIALRYPSYRDGLAALAVEI